MDQTQTTISFVIPVFNGLRFIDACLGAIRAEQGENDEIIVVDNGSTDGTPQRIAGYPGVRLLSLPGIHIGALRNAGAAVARGELLAFVDADCLLARGWRQAVTAALADAAVSAAGSRYALPERPGWIEAAWFSQKQQEPAWVHYINAGNFVVRSTVFHAVGGFDEGLETGEDAELGWRLTARGYRLREDPAIRTVHLGNPKTLGGFYRKQRWHGLGMLGTFRLSWLDKPLLMTLAYLLSLATAAALLLRQLPRADGAALLTALALALAVPAVTALYRCLEFRRFRSFPQLVLLYLVYFSARLDAGFRLLFRAAARGREGG